MPSAGEADRGANGGGVETGQRELHRDQVEAGEGGRLSRAAPRLQGKNVTSSNTKFDFVQISSKRILPRLRDSPTPRASRAT